MMLRAALGAVLLPPLGDGSRVRHIEPIGAGACLVFEKPVLVDRGPSTGRLSAAVALGSPAHPTFLMTANPYAAPRPPTARHAAWSWSGCRRAGRRSCG